MGEATGTMTRAKAKFAPAGSDATDLSAYDLAVLIPCYNEVATIGRVVADFRIVLPHARV
jgi:hypothetical protein